MAAVATSHGVSNRELLWSAGRLRYQLLSHQCDVYDWYRDANPLTSVWNMSRRWGKSRLALTLCYETCLRTSGAQVHYAAVSQKQVKKLLMPHIRFLNSEAPPHLRPVYDHQIGAWRFPSTDAHLHIAGCDKEDDRESLRGTETHFGVVDEAGSIREVEYVIRDILQPQTLTCEGRLLVTSTPPLSPAHPFAHMARQAVRNGTYVERTIDTASHVTPELRAKYAAEVGGVESDTWRREYMCQFITDSSRAVLPEWQKHEANLVGEHERPRYFDAYVAIDVGYYDLTAMLFAYWDFSEGTLVIEDELVLPRQHSAEIARQGRAKERELWGDGPTSYYADPAPYLRVADCPPIVQADLSREHGYHVSSVDKAYGSGESRVMTPKEQAINELRLVISGQGPYRLKVHPRCQTLIHHAKTAVWDNSRRSYDRSDDAGHFDAVDALLYLSRSVQREKNPYPAIDEGIRYDTHFVDRKQVERLRQQSDEDRAWLEVFGAK